MLSDKRELFCREYVVDGNGAQAAIRAGYSENAAKEQASRLLTNANVKARIAELKGERVQRLQIDADWVLQEALANYGLYKDEEKDQIALKYFEMIGKHIGVGAFKDKVELSGNVGLTHEQALKELE